MKYLYNEFEQRLMAPGGDDESQGGNGDIVIHDEPDEQDDSSEEGTYKAPSEAAQLAWLKRDLLNDGISEGKLKKFVELSEAVNEGGGGGGGSSEFVEYTFNELPEQPDWSKLWGITDIPILNETSIGDDDIVIRLAISKELDGVVNIRIPLISVFQAKGGIMYQNAPQGLFASQPFDLPSVISTLRSLGDSDTVTDVVYYGQDDYSYYEDVVKGSMKFVFIK